MTPSGFSDWMMNFSTAAASKPLVMGVLNVTPDSFSDGGRFHTPGPAVEHALQLIEDGADLIDVGGESTRPGSQPVPPTVQIERVSAVLAGIRSRSEVAISIDTTSAVVAEAALAQGANIVNDISAGRDDAGMFPLAAARKVPLVLMHMRGTPATMQRAPTYADVVAEVAAFLDERVAAAIAAGVSERLILLDPGIGFGKTVRHNLKLLAHLPELAALGRPLLVGTSRKGFIAKAVGSDDENARLLGTAATVGWAVAAGAAVLRVHDVAAMSAVVRMTRAITGER